MPTLMGPEKNSFIPGRHIADNIIMVQKIVHSIDRMKCKQGYMAIKVDLEKAYDRIHWSFIQETLIFSGLPS